MNVEIDGELDESSAADLFLKAMQVDDEDPSKKKASDDEQADPPADPKPDQDADDTEETPDDEGDEDEGKGDEKPTSKKYVDENDTYIKVKVGEEEHEVPVKDLRRLFGQEAALTRKSQAVAEAQKKADAETAKALASLDVLLKRAQERSKPYRELDFMKVAKELDDDSIQTLRRQAQSAFEDEQFLQNELGNFMQTIQQQQFQQRQSTARETIKTLSDQASPYYVEGWNQQTYDDLRKFAISEGVDANIVNNVIEAPVIKMMHMAMLYRKGQSKVITQKTNKAPKKIIKSSSSPITSKSPASAMKKKADAKLKQTGSQDAAVDAFLARMAVEED